MSLDTGDAKKSSDFGSTISPEIGRENYLSVILKIFRSKAYFKTHLTGSPI
jgi:hypothetical protein